MPDTQFEVRLPLTERVTLGKPAASAVLEEAERMDARRVFILASATLERETDEIDRIARKLGTRHAATVPGPGAHAPVSRIARAARAAEDAKADLIVAIGGGSVIDCAKVLPLALAHGATDPGAIAGLRIAFDEGGGIVERPGKAPEVPVVCVPTTLSGAEFNSLAGALDEEQGRKLGFQHERMAPVAIVLDPAITVHTPDWLWLSTGIRAVDHAVETLCGEHSNPYHDGLAESGLKLLCESLRQTKADPANLDARLRSQVGAWQASIPLAGGVPMGASHAIGHALGSVRGVPHGYTSCVMGPPVQRWNGEAARNRERLSAAFGEPGKPVHEQFSGLVGELGLPTSLGDVGVSQSDFDRLAEITLHDIWGGTNVRPLRGPEDVRQILALAT
ncbi:maleylacetate reductase [Novosphingobium marinum]|uniref:Alcohol dehydrogenase class IV n=1 Tax=Novosphingobium marinum TaxID=1514948 RepID=A0A7Y9XSJ0_9SPHN|nr:iron-containing alcohol dehydrogenase [Novosphingobium marinum]NYH93776.1 alcohol dehydrogenase class IV [Novosphingobium marinum]GGC17205.1 maleylacetate reductase [Novosphingobium marinum]